MDFIGAYQEIARTHPFGVLNTKEGFRVIEITSANRGTAIGLLRHDTSRDDPTLVYDVLTERLDPEQTTSIFFTFFTAFFPDLKTAVERIDAHEARYGWERMHVRDCQKALETAKRNLRAAEQSQQHTVTNKFDRYLAAPSVADVLLSHNGEQ